MTESRLDKIPNEIQLNILCRLSIQGLMRLYQASHYWKHRIGNDKLLWHSVYERNFGHEFAKDRWILWAVRRLWCQSSSEEKRLAARRVSLTTLEYLDGYTWYRLLRGRILTMRNWRNNTPQRVIIFPKDQHDMLTHEESPVSHGLSYGIPFISDGNNKLGFGMIDDTLNDTQLVSMSGALMENVLSLQTESNYIVLGKFVMLDSIPYAIDLVDHVASEEFIIAKKKVNKRNCSDTIVILVWNIGHLEICNTEHQSYCVPSLCMAELLPHGWWYFLEQQSGWLLIEDQTTHMDDFTQYYLLYDIRRGRLAISFSIGTDMKPTIGKVTPDKVQIYYGHTKLTYETEITSEYCQYYWHTIDVSVQSDMPTSTIDLTWYNQIPTNEAIETVKATYRAIMECVKDQGYWCGKGYLLKTNSANEGMLLSTEMGLGIQPQHLIDDMFLLTPPDFWIIGSKFILIHSLLQQHVIWSKSKLDSYVLIPEEKAILTYDVDGTVQLLDMYTGNILNSFSFQECCHIDHIIGPFCYFCGTKRMLIDVRTGETVGMPDLDPIVQSWMRSVLLSDMERNDIVDILGPTCINYISIDTDGALSCEYAQV
jgi:hypothetical protein